MTGISASHILERTFRKYAMRVPLDDEDRRAFFALPFEIRHIGAHRYMVREATARPASP